MRLILSRPRGRPYHGSSPGPRLVSAAARRGKAVNVADAKGVQSLSRALDIIELLHHEPSGLGVTEIATRLDLTKSTVHRILSYLAERGFIERAGDGQAYRLGLKFVEIASGRLNQLELKTEAAPHLRRLVERLGQPAHLAILAGTEVVYIDKVESLRSIRMYSQIGKRIPAYCSALGKALLVDLGAAELERLAAGIEYRRLARGTRIGAASLVEAVRLARERGWSLDDEENEDGIRCVGAPVRDYTGRVIAAISVSGDRRIIAPERDAETAIPVMETAAAISARMGYTAPARPAAGSAAVDAQEPSAGPVAAASARSRK